jgi:hypothetical protein
MDGQEAQETKIKISFLIAKRERTRTIVARLILWIITESLFKRVRFYLQIAGKLQARCGSYSRQKMAHEIRQGIAFTTICMQIAHEIAHEIA